MDILNAKTLEDALVFCDKHPGASVGIACSCVKNADELINAFWAEITNGRMNGWEMGRAVSIPGRAKLVKRNRSGESSVTIFASHFVEIYGLRYNKILCDKDVPVSILEELYRAEWSLGSKEVAEVDDGKELDEFLNSFKIV